MKEDDVGTDMYFTVRDQDGTIVNLTGAASASLTIKVGDEAVVIKDMIFVDRLNGLVKYKIEAGVLSEPGDLQAEVKVVFDASNTFYADTVIETVSRRLK